MKERIDNWYKTHSPPVAQAQANILEISVPQSATPNGPVMPYTSSMPYITFPTSQDEEELARLKAVTLANLKWQEIRKCIGTEERAKNPPANPNYPSNTSNEPQNIPSILTLQPPSQMSPIIKTSPTKAPSVESTSHQPQYHFFTPIEDPKAI